MYMTKIYYGNLSKDKYLFADFYYFNDIAGFSTRNFGCRGQWDWSHSWLGNGSYLHGWTSSPDLAKCKHNRKLCQNASHFQTRVETDYMYKWNKTFASHVRYSKYVGTVKRTLPFYLVKGLSGKQVKGLTFFFYLFTADQKGKRRSKYFSSSLFY